MKHLEDICRKHLPILKMGEHQDDVFSLPSPSPSPGQLNGDQIELEVLHSQETQKIPPPPRPQSKIKPQYYAEPCVPFNGTSQKIC